jgi:hypothetical protein
MHLAAREHLGERVTDQLADAELALRRARGRMIAMVTSGHEIRFLGVITRESG